MELGKKVAIFDWNGAESQPLENGRKSPVRLFFSHFSGYMSKYKKSVRQENFTF